MENMAQMKHSYVKIGWLAVVLLLAVPGRDALGDTFYQFVDKNGTIHFTNVPTDPRYRVLREDRPAVRLRPTVPDPSLHQTIAQTARRHQVNPVSRAELDAVADTWVDCAMRLEDRDMRMMSRVVRAQMERMDAATAPAAAAPVAGVAMAAG